MKLAWGALLVLGVVGCGDAPTCEEAIEKARKHMSVGDREVQAGIAQCKEEKWSSSLRSCIAAAGSQRAAGECMRAAKQGEGGGGSVAAYQDYMKRSKRSEAELNLNAIEKAAKAYYVEHAEYPRGRTGLTPAEACCFGPNHRCAPDPAVWRDGPWELLDFEVTEPHHFQYTYQSVDGQTFTARAVGDLDCDTTTVEFVLQGRSETGVPAFELERPTNRD